MGNESSRPGDVSLQDDNIQVRVNEPVVAAAHGKIHRLHGAQENGIEPASLQGSGFFYHPDMRALKSKGIITRVGHRKLPPKLGSKPEEKKPTTTEEENDELAAHKTNIPEGTPVELFYARPKGSGRVFYIKSDNREGSAVSQRRKQPSKFEYIPEGGDKDAAAVEQEQSRRTFCVDPPVFGEPSFTHRELYSESGAIARQDRIDTRKQDYDNRVQDDQKEQEREQREREQKEQAEKEASDRRVANETAAATKIQAMYRGHAARGEYQKRRDHERGVRERQAREEAEADKEAEFERKLQRRATNTWEDGTEMGSIPLPEAPQTVDNKNDDDDDDDDDKRDDDKEKQDEPPAPVEDTEQPKDGEKKEDEEPVLPELVRSQFPTDDVDGLQEFTTRLLQGIPSGDSCEFKDEWLARIKEVRVAWKKTIRGWEKDFHTRTGAKPEKADKMSIKSWYMNDKKLKEKEAKVSAMTAVESPKGQAQGEDENVTPASAPPPSGPPPSGSPPSGPPPSGPPPSGPPTSGPPPSGPPPSGPPPSGPPPSGPPPSGPPPSGPPPSGPPPSGAPPSGPPPSGPPPSAVPEPAEPAPPEEPATDPAPADPAAGNSDLPSSVTEPLPVSDPDALNALTKAFLKDCSSVTDDTRTPFQNRLKELRNTWKKTIRQWEKDWSAEHDGAKPETSDKMAIKAWYMNDKKLKKAAEGLAS